MPSSAHVHLHGHTHGHRHRRRHHHRRYDSHADAAWALFILGAAALVGVFLFHNLSL